MRALLRLAARNLARNRRRTAIALVALVLGIGSMVAIRGFINGQQRSVIENLVEGQLGALQVHRAGYRSQVLGSPLSLDMEDSPALRERMLSIPGVKGVAPRIQFGAMISTPDAEEPGKTSFFMATAVDPAAERVVGPRRLEWLTGGRLFGGAGADEVVLNADFAVGLSLEPVGSGERPPEALRPALLAADRDGSLNGESIVVGGTLLSATPVDKRHGLVPLTTAQRLLRMEGRVTEYAVAVERLEDIPRVRAALAAALGPEYEVHSYDEIFPFILELTATQDFVFGIVVHIFLVVVLLGIVNAMLMSVLERVREIGTMLAVGMRRRQVVALFVLEGVVLGLLGGALGVGLGFAVVQWLSHVGIHLAVPGASLESVIRPYIAAPFLLRALGLATVGSALATLWPALRASGLRPVEALQHV